MDRPETREESRESSLAELAVRGASWLPHASARELDEALAAVDLDAPLAARCEALVRVLRWLGGGTSSPEGAGARLSVFVELLRRAPAARARFAGLVRSVLAESRAASFFADTGLPPDHRFLSEAVDRAARRILPTPPDDRSIAELLGRALPSRGAGDYIEAVAPGLLAELFELLGAEVRAPVAVAMREALAMLAVRVAALGLHRELQDRGADDAHEAPFLQLVRACEQLAALPGDASDPAAHRQARAGCERAVERCRAVVDRVRAHLEECGVSVDLVYRLQIIGRHLARIEELARLLVPEGEAGRGVAGRRLVAELVRADAAERSLGALVRGNLALISRKIIERAGASGEHYITTTRAEHRHMLRSAAGGGLLTTATVVLKFALGGLKLPLFFAGLFSSLNYAGSFLVMQFLGFTLATKQPSVTAAALAGALKDRDDGGELEPLVDQIARITRSQLAAVAGNLGAVAVGATLLHLVWRGATGRALLDAATAEYVIHSLDPVGGGTVAFAALTGFLLWSSSIAAGWLENWTVYRRLPEGIARHRGLVRLAGERNAARVAAFLARHVSGLGGNVSLGFLLGMVPVFGIFFGLPLEVRHVTLSAGSLVLAAAAQPEPWLHAGFWWAIGGVAAIGLLNFGVSFALALAVAVRARDVQPGTLGRLGGALLSRLRRSPREFVFPPKEDPAAPQPDLAH